jgi:secondary thiamine-phosphate synthase enzyme
MAMAVVSGSINLETRGEGDTHDLTSRVQRAVGDSGLESGTVNVFVPGSTAGVTTIEYEPGVVADLGDVFEEVAPRGRAWKHEEAWHDGNGHSHVRAAMLGPSMTVPFTNGQLVLGTWQQIVLVDFDNRSRSRRIHLQMIGE